MKLRIYTINSLLNTVAGVKIKIINIVKTTEIYLQEKHGTRLFGTS